MKTSLIVNPTITPPAGVARIMALPKPPAASFPLCDRFHAYACRVCADGTVVPAEQFVGHIADAVAEEDREDIPVDALLCNPRLTAGQKRLLTNHQDILTRLLDRAPRWTDGMVPPQVSAVIALLEEFAEQARELDATLDAENARRRETAAARPTLALALGRNRAGGAS